MLEILNFLPINPDDEEDVINYVQNITNVSALSVLACFFISFTEVKESCAITGNENSTATNPIKIRLFLIYS